MNTLLYRLGQFAYIFGAIILIRKVFLKGTEISVKKNKNSLYLAIYVVLLSISMRSWPRDPSVVKYFESYFNFRRIYQSYILSLVLSTYCFPVLIGFTCT